MADPPESRLRLAVKFQLARVLRTIGSDDTYWVIARDRPDGFPGGFEGAKLIHRGTFWQSDVARKIH